MADSKTAHDLENNYKRLREKVFERRPVLFEILQKNGSLPLSEYAKTYYRKPSYPISADRKKQFLDVFRKEAARLYGEKTAEDCVAQLNNSYHLATTEHHGSIGISRQLNNNLITSLPFLDTDSPHAVNIVAACANISFNNWTFPRGYVFNSYTKKGYTEAQMVFFGHTVDSLPVIHHKAYSQDAVKNMRKHLYTQWNQRGIGTKEYKKILQLVDSVFADKKILSQKTYTDQMAIGNQLVWEKAFEVTPRKVPKLIYVEQEKLSSLLLLHHHLENKTIIHDILFDKTYLDLVPKYFEGIICGFSEKTQYGTYMFWGLPKGRKHRLQLWKKGNELVSSDGSYKVALTPEGIKKGLEQNELIPSVLLSFILLAFYYGIRLVGGPNQTTYLTQMKEAFMNMQKEYGDLESVAFCKDIPTTDFLPANPPVLAFVEGLDKKKIPASILDVYIHANSDILDLLSSLSKKITLEESVNRTLPLWYKRCYTEAEREESIAKITEFDIDKITGFDKKIVAFADITPPHLKP